MLLRARAGFSAQRLETSVHHGGAEAQSHHEPFHRSPRQPSFKLHVLTSHAPYQRHMPVQTGCPPLPRRNGDPLALRSTLPVRNTGWLPSHRRRHRLHRHVLPHNLPREHHRMHDTTLHEHIYHFLHHGHVQAETTRTRSGSGRLATRRSPRRMECSCRRSPRR